jgi:heme exporter protein CcmD
MSALAAFFGMGGYAAFVWPSLAITLVVLAGLYLASRRLLRANEAALRSIEGESGEARS